MTETTDIPQVPVENQKKPGKAASFFFHAIAIKALILFPLFMLTALLIFLLTSSDFYTGILKNSDLIATFVKATRWDLETRIKNEIEEQVQLDSCRRQYQSVKNDYEEKKDYYQHINKTERFDALTSQRNELSRLTWKKAPDVFKNENEFKNYKKIELEKLDSLIDEVKTYRKENRDVIYQAEDDLDDAEEIFEDTAKTLQKKEEQAQKIIMSHENSLLGKIYSDLDIVSPILSDELNTKVIEKGMKTEIEKMISFMTTYRDQVEAGNVARNPFNINLPMFMDTLRIALPELRVSLWIEEEVNGIRQKRHLLSEIFVDKIQEIPDLQKRDVFVNLFKFSESGLAESLGRSYLDKINLSIQDGIVRMKPVALTGKSAETMEIVMIAATCAQYAKYALLAAALIFIAVIALFPFEKRKKAAWLSRILIYPSVIMLVAAVGAIVATFNAGTIFPELASKPVFKIYSEEILPVFILHIMIPVAAMFTVFTAAGTVIKIKNRPPEKKAEEISPQSA